MKQPIRLEIIREIVKAKIQNIGTARLYDPSKATRQGSVFHRHDYKLPEEKGFAQIFDLTGEWNKTSRANPNETVNLRAKNPEDATPIENVKPEKESMINAGKRRLQSFMKLWSRQ